MKMSAVLKRQQFEDSSSEKTEPRGLKCQRLYAHGNEEGEGLDKFKGKGKGNIIGYVLFPFVASPQKESNRPTDMSEKTKSLNYLV